MHIEFYEQHTSRLLRELRVSTFTFNLRKQQFLLPAGYSLTPVQSTALPVEFCVSESKVRIFFKSKTDADDFIDQMQSAIAEGERRNNTMLD